MDNKNKIEAMLNRYTRVKNEIKNLELDIEELQNEYTGCGAIGYSEKTGPTYAFNSRVENEVISKDKKIRFLKNLKREKEIKIEKINNAMEVLTEDECKVIKYKFFQDHKKSWTMVSYSMQMCEAWCRQLKDRAIKKMIPIIFVAEQTSEKIAE